MSLAGYGPPSAAGGGCFGRSRVNRPASLLRPRWDLNPHLWARGNGRKVGFGTGTVVPVPLGRSPLPDNRPRLDDQWRRAVVGRGMPPQGVPQEWGSDQDGAVAVEVTMESVVAVKTAAAVAPVTPCVGRRCRNEKECTH